MYHNRRLDECASEDITLVLVSSELTMSGTGFANDKGCSNANLVFIWELSLLFWQFVRGSRVLWGAHQSDTDRDNK